MSWGTPMTLTWLQWGDIPTWLAAIGTVGGLFYALRLFRREAQTGRQRDEDRLRELARFVAVWINEKGTLTMRNGGPEPAYDVGVYHSREEDLDPGESLLLLY